MFLYLVFVVFSRLRLDKYRLTYWLVGYVALLSVYVLGENHFATFSSVAPVITVFLASLLFFKSGELMGLCQRCTKTVLVVTIFALFLSWWMYVQGWHFTHKTIATFSSFSTGFALFMSLLTFIKATKESLIIKYFAKISYEVYLVHSPLMALTTYIFRQFGCDNRILMIPVWLLLTCLIALGVNKATQRITLLMNNTN